MFSCTLYIFYPNNCLRYNITQKSWAQKRENTKEKKYEKKETKDEEGERKQKRANGKNRKEEKRRELINKVE